MHHELSLHIRCALSYSYAAQTRDWNIVHLHDIVNHIQSIPDYITLVIYQYIINHPMGNMCVRCTDSDMMHRNQLHHEVVEHNYNNLHHRHHHDDVAHV